MRRGERGGRREVVEDEADRFAEDADLYRVTVSVRTLAEKEQEKWGERREVGREGRTEILDREEVRVDERQRERGGRGEVHAPARERVREQADDRAIAFAGLGGRVWVRLVAVELDEPAERMS